MLPHFGEYVVLKLDPIASLESLNDPEVTKACQSLETKSYVACVTYLLSFPLPGVEYVSVNMTLLSQGLPKEHQKYLVTPDMSVPVLPNTSNPLSRPPLVPTTPLPWSDCYHSTQVVATCRIRNDITIGKPWPNPKYQLKGRELFLLSQGYCREDGDRREAMKEEQKTVAISDAAGYDNAGDQLDERRASAVTLPRSEHDADSQEGHSAHEVDHVDETQMTTSRKPSCGTDFLRRLLAKTLPCVSCVQVDCDDDKDFSDDPLWALNIFGRAPPNTMPVMVVSDDLESVTQINDPWDFYCEVDALKKIETDYYERVKAKVQADIERTRQKDEELHARLQSKMPKFRLKTEVKTQSEDPVERAPEQLHTREKVETSDVLAPLGGNTSSEM